MTLDFDVSRIALLLLIFGWSSFIKMGIELLVSDQVFLCLIHVHIMNVEAVKHVA